MSIFKKILLGIVILIAVLFACAFAAYKLIDDKTIEDKTLEVLQNTLQRDVAIDGKFELTRSLHPTLKTTGIRIASANWDPHSNLLEAGRLEVGIDLLDLLRGVVSIENMIFENAILNIKLNESEQSNLEFSTKDVESDKQPSLDYLDVIDVEINRLQINYSDQSNSSNIEFNLDQFKLLPKNKDTIQLHATSSINGQPLEITSSSCRIRHFLRSENCKLITQLNSIPFETRIEGNLNLHGSNNQLSVRSKGGDINELKLSIETSLPVTQNILVEFILSGAFDALRLHNLKGELELIGTRAVLNGEIASINSLQGIDISADISGSEPAWLDAYQDQFPGKLIDQFSISAQIKDDNQNWKISDLNADISVEKSTLTAQGEITTGADILQVALNAHVEGTDPEWINTLQDAIAAEQIDKFSLQANISNPENTWTVNDIDASLTANNSILSAQGTAAYHSDTGPDVNVTVSALGDNLQDFEKVFKQALPASEQFSITTTVNFKQSVLTLNPLALQIDNTKLEGNSVIELSSPPDIQATLEADSVNVEHIVSLIPAENDQNKDSAAAKDHNPLFNDDPISLDWLQTANTDISLKIDELIYKDATLKDVQTEVNAKNNQATFELTSLQYQDASLRSSAAINGNNKQYTYNLHTESFDLGTLLKEMDVSTTLTGKIDASIDLSASGNSSAQIAATTNGKVTAIMTEGSLADAPIDLLASNLLVELMPGRSKSDNTKIECMFMQLSSTDGVFNTDAAMLNTENIVMTANGTVDLKQEMLNFLLVPKPKDIELFTLDANIRVKGDIVDPGFSLDKGSLFKKLLKSAATIALGPAASLAIPFASMGTDKQAKCFSEVADTTSKAIKAQEEAERKAREEAERKAAEEAAAKEAEAIEKATVEPLDP